jgi:hypothetical protein
MAATISERLTLSCMEAELPLWGVLEREEVGGHVSIYIVSDHG